MKAILRDKPAFSWILYDWANSAFATTVMAGFFPIFFKQYWSAGVDATVSTVRLGSVNSIASMTIALTAPILGAIADGSGWRKRSLLSFAVLGIGATASLYFVAEGEWQVAAAVYIVALIGFSGSNVFYDALLNAVAKRGQADTVSAIGFAVGYLGGGLIFAVNVLLTLMPERFGLGDASAAVRLSFMMVAVWWGVFSLPLAVNVREMRAAGPPRGNPFRAGFAQLSETFHETRKLRTVMLFLVAYWLYIDGVHTIVRMAVDYGLSLGFPSNSLIVALLITQFVGFPATLVFGRIGQHWSAKRGILIGVTVYVVIAAWGARLQHIWEFYALAVLIGLVQGGVTSLSRSFYARLIPVEKSAQFFGFYNTLGRFSAVLGPTIMGWVGFLTGNPRMSMVAIIVLFVSGGVILTRVRDPQRNPVP